jgi:hypothetical protein
MERLRENLAASLGGENGIEIGEMIGIQIGGELVRRLGELVERLGKIFLERLGIGSIIDYF